MTDFTWPADLCPATSVWRLLGNAGAFGLRSAERMGDRWGCTLTFPPLRRADAYRLRAFVARLRGCAHRLVLPDHSYRRRGAASANLTVSVGSQLGLSLVCTSAQTNLVDAVLPGDRITVEGRLYMIAAAADTDGSGGIALTLTHPLYSAPPYNLTVNLLSPTARFLCMGDGQGWSEAPGGLIQLDPLELLEDIT